MTLVPKRVFLLRAFWRIFEEKVRRTQFGAGKKESPATWLREELSISWRENFHIKHK